MRRSLLINPILRVLLRRNLFREVSGPQKQQIEQQSAKARPVQPRTVAGEQKLDPPNTDFAEEIGVPAVLEEAVNDKAFAVARRQLLELVAVELEKAVLLGLEIPLLLVGGELAGEEQQPEASQESVGRVEWALVGQVDGGGEPEDQHDLVVGDEDDVEHLDEHPVVVFADVFPAVVLPAALVAALAVKVVGQPHSPHARQTQHDPLPA